MNNTALQQAQADFLQNVCFAWQQQTLQRLILSQYQGELEQLQKISVRPIVLKDQPQLHVVYRYQTRDVTKNYTWDAFESLLEQWLQQCQQFNLLTDQQETQLKYKKQQWKLTQSKIKPSQKQHQQQITAQQHDRSKKRWVEQDRVFLQLLGITDQKHDVIPVMARKWKQINKFVEIFAGTIQQAGLLASDAADQQPLYVVDFGSGKGYLTCAVYDYLVRQGLNPQVTGVELRQELVQFCQNVADQTGYTGLQFFQGDVRSYQPEQTDVMIALHACDIATDFAIHTGIRLGAKVVMCSPCCHKELRPQLKSPQTLQPMLQYGLHAGQQAEMLTDTLRALFLQAYGYDTRILEFVSLEHTSKNKMIVAVRQRHFSQPDQNILAQIQELKTFYGIEKHMLELLLKDLPVDRNIGCAC